MVERNNNLGPRGLGTKRPHAGGTGVGYIALSKRGSAGARGGQSTSSVRRGRADMIRGKHVAAPERTNATRGRDWQQQNAMRWRPRAVEPEPEPEAKEYKYYVLYKPFGVPGRFDDSRGALSLATYVQVPGIFPVGMLDTESEGLLIFTNDPRLRYAVGHRSCTQKRVFLAQVERIPNDDVFACLRAGVSLKDGAALPIEAELISEPKLAERPVPIRERKNVPTSWLKVVSIEGWSKHVRRVSASVGFPTLRLVHWALGPVSISDMQSGRLREMRPEERRWVERLIAETPEPRKRSEHALLYRAGSVRQASRGDVKPFAKKRRWAVREERRPFDTNGDASEESPKRRGGRPKGSRREGSPTSAGRSGGAGRSPAPKRPGNRGRSGMFGRGSRFTDGGRFKK